MSDEAKAPEAFWGMVEVMGHNQYVGFISEYSFAGAGFVRVDIPECAGIPGWSKVLGTGSIYAITPMDEAMARAMAAQNQQTPLNEFALMEMAERLQLDVEV